MSEPTEPGGTPDVYRCHVCGRESAAFTAEVAGVLGYWTAACIFCMFGDQAQHVMRAFELGRKYEREGRLR